MNNTGGKKELIKKLLTSEVFKEEQIKDPKKKIKGSRKHKKVSNPPKVVIDLGDPEAETDFEKAYQKLHEKIFVDKDNILNSKEELKTVKKSTVLLI